MSQVYILITSAMKVICLSTSACWIIWWFVSQQDYTKGPELIYTEFGGGMGHEPRNSPLNSGADPDHLL